MYSFAINCLGHLALPAPSPAAHDVQGEVSRGAVKPGSGVWGIRGVPAIEGTKRLLRHVLRLLPIGQDPVGHRHDLPVLGQKQAVERIRGRPGRPSWILRERYASWTPEKTRMP